METFVWVILYIFTLSLSIVCSSLLMQYSLAETAQLETIMLFASCNGICFIMYYSTVELFMFLCFKPRYQSMTVEYNDLQHAETEVMKGKPKLHIRDVWVLVYGLGTCFYVVTYVITCMHLLSLQTLTYGLFLIMVQEIASSHQRIWAAENLIYGLAGIIAFVAVFIKGVDMNFRHWSIPFLELNLFQIVLGVLLPFLASFLYVHVKVDTRYSFEGLFELCKFGFPFYFILCVFTVITSKMFQCDMDFTVYLFEKHLPVTILLSPAAVLLANLLIVEALIKNHMVDVMISLSFSFTLIELIHNGQNQIALVSMILTLLALFVRLTLFAKKPVHKTHVELKPAFSINDEDEPVIASPKEVATSDRP